MTKLKCSTMFYCLFLDCKPIHRKFGPKKKFPSSSASCLKDYMVWYQHENNLIYLFIFESYYFHIGNIGCSNFFR